MTRKNVKQLALRILTGAASIRSGELAAAAGITRQAAHRHLRAMVERGELVREGSGRGTRYRAAGRPVAEFSYPIDRLEEDRVWDDLAERTALGELTGNLRNVFHYALIEMVNNAIDHSQASSVTVRLEFEDDPFAFEVLDRGVGIFEKVRATFALDSRLAALQHLSKGKVTTDPEHHTGEGIFFTSKLADVFQLDSGGLRWTVDTERQDMSIAASEDTGATCVRFEVSRSVERTPRSVFDAYTEDFEFTKTHIVIHLFEYGERFVSRSEARRLVDGLDRFREVILDFDRVEGVGQGFADEVFRVWANAHPEVRLVPVHMAEPVAFFVSRALRSR